MCRRNNLIHRRVTSVGQKVQKKAVEIAKQFLEDMKNVNLQILQTWGNEMFHDERNLREMYLQKKVRWVFQYRKIHFINGLN